MEIETKIFLIFSILRLHVSFTFCLKYFHIPSTVCDFLLISIFLDLEINSNCTEKGLFDIQRSNKFSCFNFKANSLSALMKILPASRF